MIMTIADLAISPSLPPVSSKSQADSARVKTDIRTQILCHIFGLISLA
jgi:hypothetical protein